MLLSIRFYSWLFNQDLYWIRDADFGGRISEIMDVPLLHGGGKLQLRPRDGQEEQEMGGGGARAEREGARGARGGQGPSASPVHRDCASGPKGQKRHPVRLQTRTL